jgi:ketosteroid isomerase-like protein
LSQLRITVAVCALLALAPTANAHPQAHTPVATANSPMADASASGVVDNFHAALARGDTAVAERLLSAAAVVFEGGSAERSRAEYASAHLAADAAFEQAVGSQMVRRSGGTSGDLAWVASEGRTTGQFQGRDVDRVTTETMVLRRISGTWKIVHVHWSSHAATAAH